MGPDYPLTVIGAVNGNGADVVDHRHFPISLLFYLKPNRDRDGARPWFLGILSSIINIL
jgi:hypothetical protein